MDSKANDKSKATTRRFVVDYRYSVPNARPNIPNPTPRQSAPNARPCTVTQLQRETIATELSTTAALDEMNRSMASLIAGDETAYKELIKRCEANRLNNLLAKRELLMEKARVKKMEAENKSLESQLRIARRGFAKELKKQIVIKTETKTMSSQLKNIKDFVESQPSTSDTMDTLSEHVLSRITEVDTLLEGKTEDSLDGTLFDKSEENIDETDGQ